MSTAHTATRFKHYKSHDGRHHIDLPGDGVAVIHGASAEENAVFLVRAGNAHDDLVRALRTMQLITSPGLSPASAYHDMPLRDRIADLHAKANVALAAADAALTKAGA